MTYFPALPLLTTNPGDATVPGYTHMSSASNDQLFFPNIINILVRLRDESVACAHPGSAMLV